MSKNKIEVAIATLDYHNKHFEIKGSGVYCAIEIALEIMRKECKHGTSTNDQGE